VRAAAVIAPERTTRREALGVRRARVEAAIVAAVRKHAGRTAAASPEDVAAA